MRFFDWGPPLADGETNRFDTRPPAEWPQGPKALALADALAHDCVNHWDIVRAYEALETVFPDYPPAAIDKILRHHTYGCRGHGDLWWVGVEELGLVFARCRRLALPDAVMPLIHYNARLSFGYGLPEISPHEMLGDLHEVRDIEASYSRGRRLFGVTLPDTGTRHDWGAHMAFVRVHFPGFAEDSYDMALHDFYDRDR